MPDRRDERGATAVEYGLLIVGIAAVITVVVFALGPLTKEMFSDTCEGVEGRGGISATCDS